MDLGPIKIIAVTCRANGQRAAQPPVRWPADSVRASRAQVHWTIAALRLRMDQVVMCATMATP